MKLHRRFKTQRCQLRKNLLTVSRDSLSKRVSHLPNRLYTIIIADKYFFIENKVMHFINTNTDIIKFKLGGGGEFGIHQVKRCKQLIPAYIIEYYLRKQIY